ncbi:MAG: ABC transporter substrate-binding protein [Gammaproteobacteria bacterium]
MNNSIKATVAALALTSMSPAFAAGTLVGAFDVGPGGDPQVALYQQSAGGYWLSKMYTPLVMMTPDFGEHTSEGALAVSWEANADATVWTFVLRDGVKWHDGEPFTASDVKFTAELVGASDAVAVRRGFEKPENVKGWKAYNEGKADSIAGVKVVNDTTIEFHLVNGDPRFFDTVRLFYVLPEHAVDFTSAELNTTDWWFTKPVGTGPFKFSAYAKDQYMELVPHDEYWDGKPKLDKLINRYFVDEAAAVLALNSGDIDFSYVSADVAAGFEDKAGFELFSGPSFVANLYNFNYKRDAWKDRRVRQAIMHGIDRRSILDDVFNGTAVATPCNDPYPAFWPKGANYYEYDPARAKALLAEAKADGIDVTSAAYEIPTYYTSQLAKDILTVMQANLADVGIKATPLFIDVPSWRVKVDSNNDFDFTYRGYGAGPAYIDAKWYIDGNQWGIDDPKYNELVSAMDGAPTPEEYTAARTALCSYQNAQATFAYFWVSTRYGVAKDGIGDFYFFPAPGGGPVVDNAHLWDKGE